MLLNDFSSFCRAGTGHISYHHLAVRMTFLSVEPFHHLFLSLRSTDLTDPHIFIARNRGSSLYMSIRTQNREGFANFETIFFVRNSTRADCKSVYGINQP